MHYDGPASASVLVRADDLHRGVTNLVENAMRYGAEVTIRLKISGTRLAIDVEDDGPGISDARNANAGEAADVHGSANVRSTSSRSRQPSFLIGLESSSRFDGRSIMPPARLQ
nr:hypothetical protein BDOA9_0162080 [Bradyrhizobium sp. DOA9]